jgi:signal transduction histidine kinase
VEDTGRGIAAEHLPHIFERYRTYDALGSGLGLFIAQQLVRLHGGELQVESAPGQGARFWFDVKRQDDAAAEPVNAVMAPTT